MVRLIGKNRIKTAVFISGTGSNFKSLLNSNYDEFPQIGDGTFHKANELPDVLKSWNQNIFNTINKYQKQKNEMIKKKNGVAEYYSRY